MMCEAKLYFYYYMNSFAGLHALSYMKFLTWHPLATEMSAAAIHK